MIIKIIKGIILIVFLFIISTTGCGCRKRPAKGSHQSSVKVIPVDKVVNNPENYKSFFAVEGIVINVDKSKNIFLLGCEDACVFMPVKYKGQMPNPKSKIIVYGKIKKQKDGKYVFYAKDVKKIEK